LQSDIQGLRSTIALSLPSSVQLRELIAQFAHKRYHSRRLNLCFAELQLQRGKVVPITNESGKGRGVVAFTVRTLAHALRVRAYLALTALPVGTTSSRISLNFFDE